MLIELNSYNYTKTQDFNNRLSHLLPAGRNSVFGLKDKDIAKCFVRGERSRLWDLDGNEYLDLYCKFGAVVLGHKHPDFQERLKAAIANSTGGDVSDVDLEVCKILSQHIPSFEKARFGLSGTETIQNAIRLARAYTNKKWILRFAGHFHGSADGIMGGHVNTRFATPFPEFCENNQVFGTLGRVRGAELQTLLIPWNEKAQLLKVIKSKHADIAAIIFEPININSGGLTADGDYLLLLRELCTRYGILLIFDEVITGVRISMGGAQEELGILPDLSIFAKGIGNGIPVSLLCGKSEIMDMYLTNQVVYGGTLYGYMLGMAAINATYSILEENTTELYSSMKRISEEIYKMLVINAHRAGIQLIIQGPCGCASFMVSDKQINSFDELTDAIILKNSIVKECLAAHGILICPTSRMYSSFCLDESDLDFLEKRIGKAMQDAAILLKRLAVS